MSIIVLSRRRNAVSPLLQAQIIGTAEPAEGASWAEVPATSFIGDDGTALTAEQIFTGDELDLEITASADMRVMVADPAITVAGGVRGRRINAGQTVTLSMHAGDRIWTRTA
jgi:methyl coenzyme M reductase gamma subunit